MLGKAQNFLGATATKIPGPCLETAARRLDRLGDVALPVCGVED